MLPKYVIIVPVDLKQTFKFINIVFCRKNALKVPHSGQLLLRFKKHQPVLRAQDLETAVVGELFKVVDVFGVISLILVTVVK